GCREAPDGGRPSCGVNFPPCPIAAARCRPRTTRGDMSTQTALEAELAILMVEALNLETSAATIDPQASLYGDGLGLDSIDLLELSLAISKKYGIQLRADDADNQRIFATLSSLAQHIEANRAR